MIQQALELTSTSFDLNAATEEAMKAIYGPLIAAIAGDGSGLGQGQDFSGMDLSSFPPNVLSGLIQQLTSASGLIPVPAEEEVGAGIVGATDVPGADPQEPSTRNEDMAGPEEAAVALNQLRYGGESGVKEESAGGGVKRDLGALGDAPSPASKAAKH